MTANKTLHCLLFVIIGLACYSNSFTVPFSFDDEITITDNTLIRDLGNFTRSAEGYAPSPEYNPRRYIGFLTFALNYKLNGLDVTGYHVVNLAIHITNAILVYFFVLLTFKTPYFRRETSNVKREKSETRDQESKTDSLFTIHYSRFIALFSALLFVVHPVQTQAVTYIVQRFTSLATMFYLLSVVMYIKGRLAAIDNWQSVKDRTGADVSITYRLLPIAYYLISLLSAVLAMKTKEISFTLPFMILLYEFTFFTVPLRKRLLFLIPILLTLIIIPVNIMGTDRPLGEIISDLSDKTRLQTDMSRWDYLFTEMRVIVTYLRLLIMPVNQNLDYDYPIYHSFFNPQVFMSFLLISALLAASVWLMYKSRSAINSKKSEGSSEKEAESAPQSAISGQRAVCGVQYAASSDKPTQLLDYSTFHDSLFTFYRLVAFGILWFFVALSVESSVIPITDVIFEHRAYLPSAGAFIALAACLCIAGMKVAKRWPPARKAIIPIALLILTVLSAVTFNRNKVWKDNVTLWEDVVRKSPRGVRPHVLLGQALLRSGNVERAIEEFQAALAIKPFSFNARIYLGLAFASKGLHDEAIEQYRIATMVNPDSADARNNLGIAFFKKGDLAQAIEQYKAALGLNPANANFHFNLGIAYERKELIEEAMEEYKAAIQLNPSERAFHQALANASGERTSPRNGDLK